MVWHDFPQKYFLLLDFFNAFGFLYVFFPHVWHFTIFPFLLPSCEHCNEQYIPRPFFIQLGFE